MLVTINSCTKSMSGKCSVTFTSPYGQGVAEWHGIPPTVGQQYDAEFEIPQTVAWGKEITPASQTWPALGVIEDGYYIVGLLEQVEEDGCVTVRLGATIVLLEATGGTIDPGRYVRVRFDRLVLYDTGL